MAININTFNGKNPFIDYATFEEDLKDSMPNCSSAEVFLFNNFPVDVSTDIGVDLLFVIAIEDKRGNYFRIQNTNRTLYLHNLIIPVKIVSSWLENEVTIEEGKFKSKDEILDYSEELSAMGYGMKDYLNAKCCLDSGNVFVHPLIFIANKTIIATEGYLSSPLFNFSSLIYYLKNCSHGLLISYPPWKQALGFSLINQDIKRIIQQASKDSRTGYLTKIKIDRISKEISEARAIFEQLNKRLIIIDGKAGTGKTSELLLVMMHCIDNAQNTLFLTFNKLLVYDIARTTKAYISNKVQTNKKYGEHSVVNLHRYFHRLSRSIGLLHLMSEERIIELEKTLISRTKVATNLISKFVNDKCNSVMSYANIASLKSELQNCKLDRGTIEVGIDIANFVNRNHLFDYARLDETIEQFIIYKKELLSRIEGDKIFLADYYNVLANTLIAFRNPVEYFRKFDIKNKYTLLSVLMNLSKEEGDIEPNRIEEKEFLINLNSRFIRRKRKRVLFVDESQDCHPFEREILFSIYGVNNTVVSSGGYEQLIRHVELCNWNVFNNKKLIGSPNRKRSKRQDGFQDENQYSIFSKEDLIIPTFQSDSEDIVDEVMWFRKGRKSFRIKKTILDFCNYVAESCNIPLGLEPVNSEDVGEIIFDFRRKVPSEIVKMEIDKLLKSSILHGCTPYEGLIILIDVTSKLADTELTGSTFSATINEYGNIEESKSKPKKLWEHSRKLSEGLSIWDGATDDKDELGLPGADETRLIYYESCRGLEAWAVACFNLDRFFTGKHDHPDAEKYLIEEEREKAIQGIGISNEQRKKMFAGTWALMALTRAIDNVYITIDDRNSVFGRMVLEYIQRNPKNVKVLF